MGLGEHVGFTEAPVTTTEFNARIRSGSELQSSKCLARRLDIRHDTGAVATSFRAVGGSLAMSLAGNRQQLSHVAQIDTLLQAGAGQGRGCGLVCQNLFSTAAPASDAWLRPATRHSLARVIWQLKCVYMPVIIFALRWQSNQFIKLPGRSHAPTHIGERANTGTGTPAFEGRTDIPVLPVAR